MYGFVKFNQPTIAYETLIEVPIALVARVSTQRMK